MTTINGNTRLKDIRRDPVFSEVGKYLIYGKGITNRLIQMGTLDQLCSRSWSKESILHGLNRLAEIAKQGSCVRYVYSQEAVRLASEKKDVNILHFPAESRGRRPFVLVCAGGAYTNVCSLAEGFPVAARLNELGYSAFVLTYRVGGKSLMPKPLEDVAAAIRYIRSHAAELNVDPERYVVAGFSAGANLCCLWGTKVHGYGVYNLPRPEALFPVYPLISMKMLYPTKSSAKMRETMFGKGSGREFDLDQVLTEEYPPCYIVCCKDDTMVPPQNSQLLYTLLRERDIPAQLELADRGGHGFGEGIGTDAEGWVERAIRFYTSLK